MAGKLVYLDTSGVLAFLDARDRKHEQAVEAWKLIMNDRRELVMTDYVRLECWSLVQRRLGLDALADFQRSVLPLCRIEAIGEVGFELLARQILLSKRRQLSLVDLSSFDCMQRLRLTHALAFDQHFTEQGFITPEHPNW
jgi:predicted nucleic acid-binding protein